MFHIVSLLLIVTLFCACGEGGGIGQGPNGAIPPDSSVSDTETDTDTDTDTESNYGTINGRIGTFDPANDLANVAAEKSVFKKVTEKVANLFMPSLTVSLSGDAEYSTNPDENGQFSFSDIPAGDYKISVTPDEQYPLQAYYPSANLIVEGGKELKLSIPKVRAISLGELEIDAEKVIVMRDPKDDKVLIYDDEQLISVDDLGGDAGGSVGISDVSGEYLDFDKKAGIIITQANTQHDPQSCNNSNSVSGTPISCDMNFFDLRENAVQIASIDLGYNVASKVKITGYSVECYYYSYKPNCPISYDIYEDKGLVYFLANLNEVEMTELGIDDKREIIVFNEADGSISKYLVDKEIDSIKSGDNGVVYLTDHDAGAIQIVNAENIDDLISRRTYYKNGLQNNINLSVDPATGELYGIYEVSKVGSSGGDFYIFDLSPYDGFRLNGKLTDITGVNGDSNWSYHSFGQEMITEELDPTIDPSLSGAYDGSDNPPTIENMCKSYIAWYETTAKQKIMSGLIANRINEFQNDNLVIFSGNGKDMLIAGVPFKIDGANLHMDVTLKEPRPYKRFSSYYSVAGCYYNYYEEDHFNGLIPWAGYVYGSAPQALLQYDWDRNYIFAAKEEFVDSKYRSLGIRRYSADGADIDVNVGLLFKNETGLKGLTLDPLTGRAYTLDPDKNELLVLE